MLYHGLVDKRKVWESAKPLVQGKVSSISFDLWIKPLIVDSFIDGVFTLSAPTLTAKLQVQEPRHLDVISAALKEVAPIIEEVVIIDAVEREERDKGRKASLAEEIEDTKNKMARAKKLNEDVKVNRNQTFDTFIVGKSNQIVSAAAEAVAKNPGKSVNPLFIYGGTGLGKTHLLNAIVNYILDHHTKMHIEFVTSENFTNDYIQTMMHGKSNPISEFREKYRTADILLIDDIQFIRDKKGTQEEFFHTFNDLVQNGKQVVVTSDRHPDEMPTLEDRMRSRFKSGLIQDVTTPSLEMWVAIIKKKVNAENYKITPDALHYLSTFATEKQLNVREIEGYLTKITFYASLNNKIEADINDCKSALQESTDTTKYQTTAEKIIIEVCKYFDITRDDIVGKRRNREFVEPRMIAIYLIADVLNIPLINIGQLVGGRDHTTIMHARNKIEGQLVNDQRIKRIVTDIRKMIDNE